MLQISSFSPSCGLRILNPFRKPNPKPSHIARRHFEPRQEGRDVGEVGGVFRQADPIFLGGGEACVVPGTFRPDPSGIGRREGVVIGECASARDFVNRGEVVEKSVGPGDAGDCEHGAFHGGYRKAHRGAEGGKARRDAEGLPIVRRVAVPGNDDCVGRPCSGLQVPEAPGRQQMVAPQRRRRIDDQQPHRGPEPPVLERIIEDNPGDVGMAGVDLV